MTTSTPSGHQEAAARARQLAAVAPLGSLDRKAAGCLVVLLASTKTLTGARKILPEIPLDDVRQAAADLLDQLTQEGEQ
jgi:hypothetical protein